MKILHFISGISPSIGGIEVFVLNIYKEQKEMHEIEVLTRYVDCSTKMYSLLAANGIAVHSLDIHHLRLSNIFKYIVRLKRFFNTHHYDVVHSHSTDDPFILKYAKLYNVRLCALHVHSYRTLSMGSINYLMKKWTTSNNCRYANLFFACSKEVGGSVFPSQYSDKITVLKNGINSIDFAFDAAERRRYRRILNISDDTFVICHVGRFEEAKNHNFLIDIFELLLRKHKKSILLLVGSGSKELSIRQKCASLGLSDNVLFTGDQEEVNKILQAADVFILPSISEGFGIAILEAQAAGLPVIVSKEAISPSVKVTSLVHFLSLTDTKDIWADLILEYSTPFERTITTEKIKESGFDIKETSSHLLNEYAWYLT